LWEHGGVGELGELVARLEQRGFGGDVETDAAARVVYATDNSVYQLPPAGVVVPASTDDLSIIAAANHELDQPFDLVARGGGTGTNGQSLTNGLVVDTRRRMNQIVSIDPEARTAVVQPGVVLGELNAALAEHGLFFAPHVSTATRATVGGMVSTDAAGKGSLVHGRTNGHVLAIDAVLADGTRWTFGTITADELQQLARRTDLVGVVHRSIARAITDLDVEVFPDLPRGFTGYNLAGVVSASSPDVDLTKILCGSEGTLALLGEITIRLTPLPTTPRLAVVSYPDFDEAIREANRLKVTAPVAIECLDERTIALAAASPAWPRLRALLGVEPSGALLLMEYEGDRGLAELREIVDRAESRVAIATTSDPADIAAAWKVRADAVGLLGQAVGGRRSVAFVEDCAVPPAVLPEFVAGFREILDRRGLGYGMFGHADVGCLHVRPALDLYDPTHEAMLREISDDVAALVARLGGVLWGEHGRGFRGEYVDLPADTIRRMREVKSGFDPDDVLNPGKLYRPLGRSDPPATDPPATDRPGADQWADGVGEIVRIDAVPLRIHRDRDVGVAERQHFDTAFGCNGNGICHHWGDAEVMCPSYKVTLDPRRSPKGRADLLRAWLVDPDDDALADDVTESLHDCLSCGACTGRCPVGVDIPELKSRFFDRRPDRSRRHRARAALLSRFEAATPVAQALARAVGPLQRVVSPVLERVFGIVDLPTVPAGRLSTRLRRVDVEIVPAGGDVGDATVVIVPDVFTAMLDPAVLLAAIDVLRAVGERPAVAEFRPSGKFDHVVGRRRRFAAAVAAQRELIVSFDESGVDLITIEPAVSLLGAHEYAAIDPTFPQSVRSLPEYVRERLGRLQDVAGGSDRRVERAVQLFGHCTEVSLAPSNVETYRAMLEAVGCSVDVVATTCCGMAGVFGHQAERQTMSAALFDRGWRGRLDASGASTNCASGYSCRSQAKRFGFADVVHPVQVMAELLSAR
jgi:(R)-2-hydroxyglutarate dehydrogenase